MNQNKKEKVDPFRKFKHWVIDIIPHTIIGTLLVIVSTAGRLTESGHYTLIEVIRTGGYLLFLVLFYWLGYAVWFIIGEITSYLTSDSRIKAETQDG